MAMYKVPVKVYQTPSGKTLWMPTCMRMLSWFVMMPAAAFVMVTVQFLLEGSWKHIPVCLLFSAAFIAAVVLLQKGAKTMAVKSCMKELEEMALREAAQGAEPPRE